MLEILEKRSGPRATEIIGRSFGCMSTWIPHVQIVPFAEVPELFLFVFLCLGCIAILVGQLAMSRDSQWDWALSCATFRQTYFFLGVVRVVWNVSVEFN